MINSVKINFKLKQDDDGYPPVAVESLWATPVGGEFEIDSIPFFVREATVGDLVFAKKDGDGRYWFESVLRKSSNSLVRVIIFDSNFEDNIFDSLKSLGCSIEVMKSLKLAAIDIPSEVDLNGVQKFLQDEATLGRIDYEEALLRH